MKPEQIVAEVYKQCAQHGRIDLIPVVVNKLAAELRKLADACEKLVREELSKSESAKRKKGKKDGNPSE